jgi:hypothetical protein
MERTTARILVAGAVLGAVCLGVGVASSGASASDATRLRDCVEQRIGRPIKDGDSFDAPSDQESLDNCASELGLKDQLETTRRSARNGSTSACVARAGFVMIDPHNPIVSASEMEASTKVRFAKEFARCAGLAGADKQRIIDLISSADAKEAARQKDLDSGKKPA